MEKFVVEGPAQLQGIFTPQGNKNEALPLIAAAILTDKPVVLNNIPRIVDVDNLLKLVEHIGVEVEFLSDHSVRLQTKTIKSVELPPEIVARLRGAITLAGPLLARAGEVVISKPGGDKIGRRRIDTHLLVFKNLGAKIDQIDNDTFKISAPKGLKPTYILMDEASVTATENAIMAASLIPGQTIIYNAASEPHVQQLARFLVNAGVKIQGIGTNKLIIEGVDELNPKEHTIEADYLEVGSVIALSAITKSNVRIKNVGIHNLHQILNVFSKMGIFVNIEDDDVIIDPNDQSLKVQWDVGGAIPKVDDGVWPAFPADMISTAIVTATQVEGTVLIFEKLYESRLFFVDKLISMGARIVLCDPHRAVVVGPTPLYGTTLVSPDIRAGMALLIASLVASGKSEIYNITQIDRGFELIDNRLKPLGAKITRIKD